MNTTTTNTAPDLRTLIETEHHALMMLRRRQYALEAFAPEIERVSRGEVFDIHNDIRWTMLLDFRDKNVIDLASWAKGGYTKGGFLGQLQCHHLRAFGPKRTWGKDSEGVGPDYDEHFLGARARLFPGCEGRPLKSTDFEAMITRFKDYSEPLLKDRHENRAHIYERNSTGTAKMLDHNESRKHFEFYQGMLNDLSLVALGSTWSLQDMNIVSVEADAKDMVDDLLLTGLARRKLAKADLDRDTFYDELHARPHDKDGKPAFNNPKAIYDVLAKHGLVRAVKDE